MGLSTSDIARKPADMAKELESSMVGKELPSRTWAPVLLEPRRPWLRAAKENILLVEGTKMTSLFVE